MTYIVQIAIINQLHDKKDIDVKLAFWMLHDLSCSFMSAVELFFNLLFWSQFGGLARKLKSVVKVLQVMLQDEHSVAESVQSAQLFELLG